MTPNVLHMSSSTLHAGDTVRLSITKGRLNERGTFTTTVVEHAEVPGLLVALAGDREVVAQRPNGEQPYAVEVL